MMADDTYLYLKRTKFRRAIGQLPGLKFYYPMDEFEGTVLDDRSPNGFNGTLVGPSLGQEGYKGPSFKFDGVNDRIDLTNSNSVKGMSALTIGVLGKVSTPGADIRIHTELVADHAVNTRLNYSLINGKLRLGGRSGAAASTFQSVITNDLVSQAWHLMIGTMDITNDLIKIYIDGPEAPTTGTPNFADASIANTDPNQVPIIGASYNGAASYLSFWNTNMQHLFLCQGILPSTTILQLARVFGF